MTKTTPTTAPHADRGDRLVPWCEVVARRAGAVTVVTVVHRAGPLQSRPGSRTMLTRAERELARSVVATADRVNLERPTMSWRTSDAPPPPDGALDRRSVAWPVASVLAMVVLVLVAFYAAAGAR